MFTLAPAASAADLAEVRALFTEYAASLGFSLAYQGFEAELAGLPGAFAAPAGALLLARMAGVAVGTVAVRALEPTICEMKRLYVQPAARGLRTATGGSIGRALATGIVDAARALGYARMRLDTVVQMTAAIALYRSLGFVEIGAYYATTLPDTAFFELRL